MYTLTVKIAKGGTTYINDEGISHPSAFGHMWYSLAGDGVQTESFGFAPKEENIYPPMGPGYVTQYDNQGYQWTYYTGQIVIDSNQYQKLLDFGINPVDVGGFNLYYRGLENSCIDFTWKALYLAGFNPSNFEGNIFPHSNADDADAALYKYLMGNLDGWDSSQPNAGDYHVIYGSNGGDVLIAELQTDAIYGGGGNDTLVGSVLNDFLVGGEGSDQLYGGGSYDTYIAGMGDTISDDDGSGEVYFEGLLLTGGTQEAGQSCESDGEGKSVYKGNGGTYTLSDGVLQFTDSNANHVRIEGFKNGDLGINLEGHPADDEECEESEEGKCPQPITPTNNISITSPTQPIGDGGSGSSSSVYTPTFACVYTPELNSAGVGGGGSSTGPIVLDLNRNGITSISLAASQALFDYDGDGVKENSAWIENSDALLVNDKNQDGIINDASELFGNYTRNSDGSIAKSGYQALSYYDTNNDGVVNNTDTRFNELSLWIDSNQDGVTDAGELKTLSETGVTSLTLHDPITPYAPTVENSNTIIQETTFTDANGEGIMRDVLFRYENTTKPTEGVYFDMDANGFKEKMTTWTEPNQWMVVKDLNGDGIINNGSEVVGNRMTLLNSTKASDTIQALKTFDSNHDGVVDAADNSGLAFWTDRNHNGITDTGELEALGSAGAIQTIKLNPYQTLLSGYDYNGDGIIGSTDAISRHLYIQTNDDNTITLYLPDNASARAMIEGYTGNESIQTAEGEKIIKSVQFYSGDDMGLNDTLSGTENGETLEGSLRNDTLHGMGGRDIIEAGEGDDTIEGGKDSDKLMGGTGNDTYLYNRGDGKDLLIDSEGTDTLKFAEGITRDDLMLKSNGADVSIYLKDENKALSELSDQIIIKDWHTTGTVENIEFSDGSTMDVQEMFNAFGSDKNDTIYGTGNKEMLIGGKGNDLLQGRGGDNTYFFTRGDGHDTIIDYDNVAYNISHDILKFGDGITVDDLLIKVSSTNNDLTVALKEEGKAFSELNNQVTISNWFKLNNRVEHFAFADGTVLDVQQIINLQGTEDADTLRFIDFNTGVTMNLHGGNDSVSLTNGNDSIHAGGGNDAVSGGNGNDTLYGDEGSDILLGQAGDDTLDGGIGNDSLGGGSGDDTYSFGRGDGKDIISDVHETAYWYNGGNDTIRFKDGIVEEDILMKQIGHNLVVALKEEGKTFNQLSDKITITNWSYNDSNTPESSYNYNSRYGIENFSFADGTFWNTTQIIAHIKTDENDTVYGLDEADTIGGGRGDDTLYGRVGNDTYVFNRGDGEDVIYDSYGYYYNNNAGEDTLQLGDGISVNDIIFSKNGPNLIVGLKEDGVEVDALADKITLQNWFEPNNRIEHLILSDGSEIDLSYLLNPTEEGDYLVYDSENDTIDALGGDDVIYTHDGDDTIAGGQGEDELYGGYGNDTYVFNRGDGQDWIYDDDSSGGNNIDTIRFGEGITKDDLLVLTNWSGMMRETQVLTIALKEEGVSFEDIKNKINISNWDYSTIERIEFYDGTTLSLNEIIALQATNEDDNIIGTYYHDVLQGGKGNDTLYGSYGNDTYIFNRGDGQDIIYDDGSYSYYEGEEVYYGGEGTIANTSGDTVEFGEGITIDEIEVRVLDGDLLIGLREDGKGFEELNDVIRISGWESNYYSNAVETMKFADGTTYNIAEYFNLSYSEEPMEAPIVVDLNGNGVTSVSIEGNTVYFDYDADGLSERTGWIERGDALLVADVNHDGIINDGSELFGNHTKLSNGTNAANGHEAMLQYDSNYDGKIDSTDERFNELLLWKDTNLDGRSSADELSTLAVNGITSRAPLKTQQIDQ